MPFITALSKPIIYWQYKDSPKFLSILNGYIDLVMKMYPYEWWEYLDLDKATGYALDLIGQRLGIQRPKDDPSTAGIYDVAEYESSYYDYTTDDVDLVKDDVYRNILKLGIMIYRPWRPSSIQSYYKALEFAFPNKEFHIIQRENNTVIDGDIQYELVGNPTIVDDMASGFSANDYLLIQQQMSANNNIDIVLCLKDIPSSISSSAGIFRAAVGDNNINFIVYQNTNGSIVCRYSSSQGTITVTHNTVVSDGHFRFNITNDGVSEYYSEDGKSWNILASNQTAPSSLSASNIRFGYTTSSFSIWDGTIDLKNTYIKLDYNPWYGPCVMKSRDIVEIHALSYMTYAERRALFSDVVVAPMATTLLKYYDYMNI